MLRTAALGLVLLVVPGLLSLPEASQESAITRARAWTRSGRPAAPEVHSLEVVGTRIREPESPGAEEDPFEFRISLPDRYQFRAGTVLHTLNGNAFWQSPEFAPETQAQARRATTIRFLLDSLTFLLVSPPAAQAPGTDVGVRNIAGLRGRIVEFLPTGAQRPVSLVLNEESCQPVALVRKTRIARGNEVVEADSVLLLLDYREVAGTRYPFRLEERVGAFHSVTTIRQVLINSVDPSAFRQRAVVR